MSARITAVCAAALVVAIIVLAAGWNGGNPAGAAGAAAVQPQGAAQPPVSRTKPAPRTTRAAGQTTRSRPQKTPLPKSLPAKTLLATLRRTSPRYTAPGVRASGVVPATWYGDPSVLPVVATKPGWLRVRLAQRPDGSTAWVPAGDVTLSSTRYLITVNLTTMHLTLYYGRRVAFSAPAGVGAVSDPTPTGHYFVALTEPPPLPNPGYGPFILVTSAHSNAISDWEGSGDAVIGIHGPLGQDRLIGTTGARISHGCIRLHPAALLRLRSVPPGTPIDIFG